MSWVVGHRRQILEVARIRQLIQRYDIDILPLTGGRDRRIDLEGKPTPQGMQKVGGQIRNVTPGYFEAIGMHVLRGRGIDATDTPGSLPAVVVNEAFGKAFFGGDAIGHRLKLDFDDRLWTIVGVVNDVNERRYWDDYQKVFSDMLSATSTEWAPWYVVPADRKWYARLCVSAILAYTLIQINPRFHHRPLSSIPPA